MGGATDSDGYPVTKPAALANAELICNILETFSGYTYTTLMEEDAEIFRILAIRSKGREEETNVQ